jgi:hypothetical protein
MLVSFTCGEVIIRLETTKSAVAVPNKQRWVSALSWMTIPINRSHNMNTFLLWCRLRHLHKKLDLGLHMDILDIGFRVWCLVKACII